jgi:hypothetical protein
MIWQYCPLERLTTCFCVGSMTVSRPLTQEMELYLGKDIEGNTYLSARDLDRKNLKLESYRLFERRHMAISISKNDRHESTIVQPGAVKWSNCFD